MEGEPYAAQGSCMARWELQEGAHGSSSFVCVWVREGCQPKDSQLSMGPALSPGMTHRQYPWWEVLRELGGCSANPIPNLTGTP